MNKSKIIPVVLTTPDGYTLHGIKYLAYGCSLGNIVVSSASAVTQQFYRRFALYANKRGFNVLTFDYRGIGQSKSGHIKDMDVSYLDWGRYDLAAAIDYMYEENEPLFLVGHSYGGQALGLLPNHNLITAAYSFGSGAGWSGWMKKSESLKVNFLWKVVLPILVKWKGYMAWSKLGMGDDLPLGIYKDWKRWCQYPNYFFDDPDYQHIKEKYAEVSIPYIAATATDDEWAPPKSRDAFCKHYINCDLKLLNITPGPYKSIGHMGYFREESSEHWGEMLHWFSEINIQHQTKQSNN
jgi:predicted alpha/beta hydrolase